MQFRYSYTCEQDSLSADLQHFIDLLEFLSVDSITNLQISCYPHRNGKRLQAVNMNGEIPPVVFGVDPDDKRYDPSVHGGQGELLTFRERPDDLGDFGLATAFNHDD